MNKLFNFFNKTTPEEIVKQGMSMYQSGKRGEALTVLKKGLSQYPQNAHIIFLYGIFSIPEAVGQEKLEISSLVASKVKKAIDLHEAGESLLDAESFHFALKIYLQYVIEQEISEKVLSTAETIAKNFPDDDSVAFHTAMFLAQHGGDSAVIEYWSYLALAHNTGNDDLRKAWKRARKDRGKDFFSDRTETEKKAIYLEVAEHHNDVFLEKIGEKQKRHRKVETPNLADLTNEMGEASKAGWQSVEKKLFPKYSLNTFELSLIQQEGEQKKWNIGKANINYYSTGSKGRIDMRDQISCVHCNRGFSAPYWPRHGNMVGFYAQSAERTKEEPGRYRLPLKCPFCEKTWYMVWDSDPGDPIGSHFLRHFEHLIENNSAFQEFLHGLVTDNILGGVVDFLEDQVEKTNNGDHKFNQTIFKEDNSIHLVTYSPFGNLVQTKQFLGNYTQYLIRSIPNEFKENMISQYNYINWVLCISPEEELSHVQLTILPSFATQQNLPLVYPNEFSDNDSFNDLLKWTTTVVPEKINLTVPTTNSVNIQQEVSRIFHSFGVRDVHQNVSIGFQIIGAASSRRLLTVTSIPVDEQYTSIEIIREEDEPVVRAVMCMLKFILLK